jgi:hypothetical protein
MTLSVGRDAFVAARAETKAALRQDQSSSDWYGLKHLLALSKQIEAAHAAVSDSGWVKVRVLFSLTRSQSASS